MVGYEPHAAALSIGNRAAAIYAVMVGVSCRVPCWSSRFAQVRSSPVSHCVSHPHDTVGVLLRREQPKRDVSILRSDERNPRANDRGNDMTVKLVQLARVEEGTDQARAAHHPDVLPRLCPQLFRKTRNRSGHEFHPRGPALMRFSREDAVLHLRVELSPRVALLLKSEDDLVCLAPHRIVSIDP